MTELKSAAEYHRLTKYNRRKLGGGGMDPTNQPHPYKTYPGADQVPLPRDLVLPRIPSFEALKGGLKRSPQPLTLSLLANLLPVHRKRHS